MSINFHGHKIDIHVASKTSSSTEVQILKARVVKVTLKEEPSSVQNWQETLVNIGELMEILKLTTIGLIFLFYLREFVSIIFCVSYENL
jgi:hypothetical protein